MRKCQLCGATRNRKRKRNTIERHHISYKPPIFMDLCCSCHCIVSNYERNPDVYNTDEPRFAVLKKYDILKVNNQSFRSDGDRTEVVSIRLPGSVMDILQGRAVRTGYSSIGEYIKAQVIKACDKKPIVNTITNPVNKVINTIPLYNRAIHKAGDRVLVQKGKQLIEVTVPETDAEGYLIYEL